MSKRQEIILALVIAFVLGLAWRQIRLPLAAIKHLADYDLLREKRVVFVANEQLQLSAVQKWHLKRSLKLVEGTGAPRVAANVNWNWGVVARVQSSLYISPEGADWLDGLYVCVFGAWLPVYSFSHAMA